MIVCLDFLNVNLLGIEKKKVILIFDNLEIIKKSEFTTQFSASIFLI